LLSRAWAVAPLTPFNRLSGQVEIRPDTDPNAWMSALMEAVLLVDDVSSQNSGGMVVSAEGRNLVRAGGKISHIRSR